MDIKHATSKMDGHRLTEFIYGTVVALVAISGIDALHASWLMATLVVVVGGVAIWLAHAYATLMSMRITTGQRTTRHAAAESLARSWPIVLAALLIVPPFLGVGLGLYPMGLGITLANWVGVIVLALVGVVAGIVAHETWQRRIALVLMSSGLGILVVMIEVAIHH